MSKRLGCVSILVIMTFLIVAGIFIVGGFSFITALLNPAPTFVNLPLPAGASFLTNITVQTVGDTEDVRIGSPFINVSFTNTGEGAGASETEVTCIQSQCGTMTEFTWGDFYTNSEVTTAEVFNPSGELIEARVSLKFDNASVIRIFACGGCSIDVSRLDLQYLPDENGWPQLKRAIYTEEYGLSSASTFAFGPSAIWEDAQVLFPQYARWGFWEQSNSPAQMVKSALDSARDKLAINAPTYKVVDEDGVNEVIGRQSGMKIYFEGDHIGDINFTYRNEWGRMPNTPFIGSGALSRVEWTIYGEYYALSILSSKLDPRPTALYIFTQGRDATEIIDGVSSWNQLYNLIRQNQLGGEFLSIYSAGHVGTISDTVSTGDGFSTVDIGNGGGVTYAVIGNPTLDEVQLAYNLISLMGRGGIKATRFFYPTAPESGNGLLYYLATLTLMRAHGEPEYTNRVLYDYGIDSGILDRVGYPNLDILSPEPVAVQ